MIKKSTPFKHVDKSEIIRGDIEELEIKMDESDFSTRELKEEFSPSDQSVRAILDFASSYYYLKSLSIKEIDLILN
jgi:hypothetical protein